MQPDDLERELSIAGDRARQSLGHAAVPDRAFTAGLRDRLLNQLPTRPPVMDRGTPRTTWSLDRLFRGSRLAPLGLAAVLVMAAGVAAGELHLIGNNPDATPTPVASVEPTPSVTPDPSASLTPTPSASASHTPAPTAAPTAAPTPTPAPTPKPTPKPTPAPDPTPPPMGSLTLAATGCDGGVVLDWSKYLGANFNHYTTLRNTVANIPMAYPPQGGAVDFGGSYATHPDKLSAVDATGSAGVTYFYRAMGFNEEDEVIASSPIVSAMPKPIKPLGPLSVAQEGAGPDTRLTWTPYPGPGGCFTYYKLVYSDTNPEPMYGIDPYLAAIGWQGESTYVAPAADLGPGTYYFRVQAIRATHLGWMVTAQSDVTTYTVP